MNLRTIKFYVFYDPKRRLAIEFRQYKNQIKPMAGCVIVMVKGNYVRRRGDSQP